MTDDDHSWRFCLVLVPAYQLEQLIADGNRGDAPARTIVRAIAHWGETMRQAERDDLSPGCVSCGVEIIPGQLAGWAVFLPQITTTDVGVAGCFCPDCYRLGPKLLGDRTIAAIGDELGGEIVSVH